MHELVECIGNKRRYWFHFYLVGVVNTTAVVAKY